MKKVLFVISFFWITVVTLANDLSLLHMNTITETTTTTGSSITSNDALRYKNIYFYYPRREKQLVKKFVVRIYRLFTMKSSSSSVAAIVVLAYLVFLI